MRISARHFLLLCSCLFSINLFAGLPTSPGRPERLLLENLGQVTEADGKQRPDVQLLLRDAGMNLFVTRTGMFYQFERLVGFDKDSIDKPYQVATYRLEMELVGANQVANLQKLEQQAYYENYYNVRGRPEGVPFVHTYRRAVFQNIYPGIDWVLYLSGEQMKYDFVIHPGGDASLIRIRYRGATGAEVNADGSVTLKTPLGEVTERPPVSWTGDADKQSVSSRFVLAHMGADYELTFALEHLHVAAVPLTLTIDPVLLWASYYGGTSSDYFFTTCSDKSGNMLFAGTFSSSALATSGAFQSSFAGYADALIAKFSPAQSRIWATYYGGTDREEFDCITTDGDNIYAAGATRSPSGIATPQAHDTILNQGNSTPYVDGLIAAFTSSGMRLWGTYFGGNYDDQIYGICVNREHQVFVSGITLSSSDIASSLPGYYVYATAPSGQRDTTQRNLFPAFIASFTPAGKKLWSTYYGENYYAPPLFVYNQVPICLTADNRGNIYIGGHHVPVTVPYLFSTPGAFQSTPGGAYEGSIAKFNSKGQRTWATFVGGNGSDFLCSITSDEQANVYICGGTTSTGMAYNGWQSSFTGTGTGFVAKYDSSGSRTWFTYLGNGGTPPLRAICSDGKGNLLLNGQTNNNFSYQPFTSYGGALDLVMAQFRENGTLKWCSPKGGSNDDNGTGIAVDNDAAVYPVGYSTSASGIAYNGFQNTYSSGTLAEGVFMKIQYDTFKVSRPQTDKDDYCRGDSAWVKFKVNTAFAASDSFFVQLSNNEGAFTSPVIIGRKKYTATGLDSLRVPLPTAVTLTGFYKVRIVTKGIDTSAASRFFNIQAPDTQQMALSSAPQICQGQSITFSVTPVFNHAAYRWQRNGVNTSSSGDTLSYFTTNIAGTYRVKVTTNAGCVFFFNDTVVTLHPYPVSTIKLLTPASQCLTGNLIKVADSSTISAGTLVSRKWVLGAGLIATGTDTQRVYATTGSFPIYLIVTSNIGCSNTNGVSINVLPSALTKLSLVSANTQCRGGNVFTMKDSSTITSGYSISSVSLLPGDGNSYASGNVSHSYAAAGNYTMKLVTTTNTGCKDSASLGVTVLPNPQAVLSVPALQSCQKGNVFVFTDSSSVTSPHSITSAMLYTGDGNSFATGNKSYTYASYGSFTPKLVVTSSDGCKDSATLALTVHPNTSVNFTINKIQQCLRGNAFVFNGSTSVPQGSIGSATWYTGDGNSNSTSMPTYNYSYTTAGTYNVKLVSVTNNGCKDTFAYNVQVLANPQASYTLNTDSQCLAGNQYVFNSTSQPPAGGSISTLFWNFGDGFTALGTSTAHSYTADGAFITRLIATSVAGCRDTLIRNVWVKANPAKPAIFRNGSILTSSAGMAYQWMLNGIAISGANAQNYTAIQNGYYQARITGTNGCTNTSDSLYIGNVGVGAVQSSPAAVVYPNPTTGAFTIQWSHAGAAQIRVTDVYGCEVLRTKAESDHQLLFPRETAAGVYLVSITHPDFSTSVRLVKE